MRCALFELNVHERTNAFHRHAQQHNVMYLLFAHHSIANTKKIECLREISAPSRRSRTVSISDFMSSSALRTLHGWVPHCIRTECGNTRDTFIEYYAIHAHPEVRPSSMSFRAMGNSVRRRTWKTNTAQRTIVHDTRMAMATSALRNATIRIFRL